MTDRQPSDAVGEWLTVGQAAAALGLSPSGFRGLAKTEGLRIRRRGNQPGVLRSDVDGYLERARIQAGEIAESREARVFRTGRQATTDFVPYEPYPPKIPEALPGLAEATTLRDEHRWTDADLAELLGIHYSNVYRRRLRGFTPAQVEAMRSAIRTAR